jgi:peroxiredoxin
MNIPNGQLFPTLTASRVGGGTMTIPQDLEGKWGIILFYRGHWCPYCRQQLIDFQRSRTELNEMGAEVVALSVDPLEKAQETVEKHHLLFPILYGLDAHEVAEKTGAVLNEEPLFLQATGFLLQPDGKVALSVYSSGAIGRLVAADSIKLLKYLQQQKEVK